MQINVEARDFIIRDALRGHIIRRLEFALSARDEHIQRVLVRLSDINGPRRRADKCCFILVALIHLSDVVIEDTQVDLYDAIDCAVDRAARTVGRRLSRQRDGRRLSGLHDTVSVTE